jgi:hypothetical protein
VTVAPAASGANRRDRSHEPIEAAIEIFHEKGYGGGSIREIAYAEMIVATVIGSAAGPGPEH